MRTQEVQNAAVGGGRHRTRRHAGDVVVDAQVEQVAEQVRRRWRRRRTRRRRLRRPWRSLLCSNCGATVLVDAGAVTAEHMPSISCQPTGIP